MTESRRYTHLGNCKNHQIYQLRNVEMDPYLQFKLSELIGCYRPHDPIPTKEQLMSDNRRPKDMSSPCSMERLTEQSDKLKRWWV